MGLVATSSGSGSGAVLLGSKAFRSLHTARCLPSLRIKRTCDQQLCHSHSSVQLAMLSCVSNGCSVSFEALAAATVGKHQGLL